MIRRVLIGVLLAGAAAVALLTGASGDPGGKQYEVELDNAFGIVDGGDVKVAGVRAGVVEKLTLDRSDMRPVISIRIDRTGFGDLRKDVFCEARQQSLIGEYFLDCKPGTSPERLPEGARIPVEQTGSTVPVDLVQDIARRPVRERTSIIFSELGAALAARGGDLNETIRRANPALREVNRVLAALSAERRTIRNLYDDADKVVTELAENRRDVARFLREARDTTGAQAAEAAALQRQFNRLPSFLRELRPTLAALGEAAERQEPALVGLTENAQRLRGLFRAVEGFSRASRPALRTLGDAGRTGRPAVLAARPRVGELRTAARPLPEVAANAAITLEHIDDPKFASERDERAGRGKDGGFTGLEALLRYVHAQSQAINTFDSDGYFLKVALFNDAPCGNYADENSARDPSTARCRAWLGPNQPGVTTPDPTGPRRTQASSSSRRGASARRDGGPSGRDATPAAPAGASDAATAPASSGGRDGGTGLRVPLPAAVEDLLDDLAAPSAPALSRESDPTPLLDYLMRP